MDGTGNLQIGGEGGGGGDYMYNVHTVLVGHSTVGGERTISSRMRKEHVRSNHWIEFWKVDGTGWITGEHI